MKRRLTCIGIGLLAIAGCGSEAKDEQESGIAMSEIQGGVVETGYPEVVRLRIGATKGGTCTGTLVSFRDVLTAAHCTPGGPIDVVFNGNRVVNVERYINHITSDQALLRLATPVTDILPRNYAISSWPAVGDTCTAVGYGVHTDANGNSTVGNKRSCTDDVESADSNLIGVRWKQLNTGVADYGDSGGPLLCNGVLMGVANFKRDGDWPNHFEEWYATVDSSWVTNPGFTSYGYFGYSTRYTWSPDYDYAMADVNGDRHADLIGRNAQGGLAVAVNSNGHFLPSTNTWGSWAPSFDYQFADVNSDGKADLVGRDGTGEVQVALSTGAKFGPAQKWATWSVAYDYKLADVNGDGKADLVGRSGSTIQVALAEWNETTGIGKFGAAKSYSWSTEFDYTLADIDGDGRVDLVGRNASGKLVIARGLATGFDNSTDLGTWLPAFDYRFADVDGDWRADIIGRNGDQVQVAISTGTGFRDSTVWASWSSDYDIRMADVNGDGRADLVGRLGYALEVAPAY